MGPLIPLLGRLVPMLFGVGESGGLASLARGAFGQATQAAGLEGAGGGSALGNVLKDVVGRVIPKDFAQSVGLDFSGKRAPSVAQIAPQPAEPEERPRRFRFGAPVNFGPTEGVDSSRGMGRIRFAEKVAELQGRAGYRIASPTTAAPAGGTGPAATGGSTSTVATRAGGPNRLSGPATGAFLTPQQQAQLNQQVQQVTGKLGSLWQTAQKYTGVLGQTLALGVKFNLWMLTINKAGEKFAELIVESNRGLSLWNGGIAASFAQLDFRRQQLDARMATANAGSITTLNEQFGKLLENSQEVRQALGTAINLLGMGVAKISSIAITLVKIFPGMKQIIGLLGSIEDLLGQNVDLDDQIEKFAGAARGVGFPVQPPVPNPQLPPPKPRLPGMRP